MKRIFYSTFIALLIITGSANAKIHLFGKKDKVEKPIEEEIPVFETGSLETKFRVLGKVTLKGVRRKDLIGKMRARAKKVRGDAILLYQVTTCDTIPEIKAPVVGDISKISLPCAQGVIVRKDDNGITEITPKTPIPVLE